ncbi:MAG: AmmeMemoRadiSam system protein A [Actinomycetota bacterium]|nr:AmmeMemoRadiSam system protein A [Actinomycetota bacterium]
MSPDEHPFVALAREAIRYYLATGKFLDPPSEPGDPPPSGVFVSLHDEAEPGQLEGPLRGCIGSVRPREGSLRREVVRFAVAAATSDPRFAPLRSGEVDDLDVTVYLLGDAEPIDGLDDLDASRYGVIVDGPGGRTGLLLPAIPGISTAAEQVDIACRKASISPADNIRLSRFEAEIIR